MTAAFYAASSFCNEDDAMRATYNRIIRIDLLANFEEDRIIIKKDKNLSTLNLVGY